MVKIRTDLIFRKTLFRELKHVTPRGGGFGFRHLVKVKNLHSHVDLIIDSNVGNVYTDD